MKEFTTAVEDVVETDEAKAKMAGLVATKMAEGMSEADATAAASAELEGYVEFSIDGRVLRAYPPNDGQLTFMLAALGRGQTQDNRFASIINIMMGCLREEDQDYFEARLLSRRSDRLPVKKVEEIFEFLIEQWFARPTQPQSGSAL